MMYSYIMNKLQRASKVRGQQFPSIIPKYENEEDEECKEDGDVVHCAQHDHKLTAKVGHEADKLQNPQ